MSAIYGSSDKKRFLELQKLNKGSRKIDHSMLFLADETYDIYKIHNQSDNFKFPRKKYNNYLGISESKSKEFEPEYLNPAISDYWVVACCGNITNVDDIIEIDDSKAPNSIAQSFSIISSLNYAYSQSDDIDSVLISKSLELLEGKFALWLHNCDNGNIFIAKNNCELYADIYDNTFSSKPCEGLEPLNDGELYQLTKEGITHVSFFDCL